METRIQPLHDGLFTFEKVLGMHGQRMLETSRCLYTGVNFKQNCKRKIDRKLMITAYITNAFAFGNLD